jgi:hypothetical protein
VGNNHFEAQEARLMEQECWGVRIGGKDGEEGTLALGGDGCATWNEDSRAKAREFARELRKHLPGRVITPVRLRIIAVTPTK